MLAAACGGEKKSDTLAQDSTLNADMQMANRDTTANPQLNDVPATSNTTAPTTSSHTTTTHTTTKTHTPAPAATSTKPATSTGAAPAARTGTIAAGTSLALASSSRVCTNTNKVGERVNATLSQAVSGSNGAVIPAGASVALEITQLKRSENVNDKIQMGFRPVSVTFGGHTYPLEGHYADAQIDKVKNQPGSKDAQKVATGAVVGAVLGKVIGKSTKGAVIGGAVGAAAGAGAAATTANYEGCVPDGGRISVTLDGPVQVQL